MNWKFWKKPQIRSFSPAVKIVKLMINFEDNEPTKSQFFEYDRPQALEDIMDRIQDKYYSPILDQEFNASKYYQLERLIFKKENFKSITVQIDFQIEFQAK